MTNSNVYNTNTSISVLGPNDIAKTWAETFHNFGHYMFAEANKDIKVGHISDVIGLGVNIVSGENVTEKNIFNKVADNYYNYAYIDLALGTISHVIGYGCDLGNYIMGGTHDIASHTLGQ